MTERETTLEADGVSFSFDGQRDFLTDISLTARSGECWGIVGPNGAGKSTLLRLLAGLRRPSRGDVCVNGVSLGAIPAMDRARLIAYLPQRIPAAPGLTAGQIVLLGRHPHRSLGMFESANDVAVARKAMVRTETDALMDRSMVSLSGGEAQRVHVAAALAQEPAVLLLDEPTTALDWRHQLAIFAVLRRMADEADVAVVVVTHDLNLAGRFCDKVVLMQAGRVVRQGSVGEVLTPDVLSPVFDVSVRSVPIAGSSVTMLVPADPVGPTRFDDESEQTGSPSGETPQ